MASSEQSTLASGDGVSAQYQTSLAEASQVQAQSHVRVPESVYNIDEETRMGPMGPEMGSDGMTPASALTTKAEGGNKMQTEPASAQSNSPAPSAQAGCAFSALSFIATQYAESDNSSPRSVASPANMEDSSGPPTCEQNVAPTVAGEIATAGACGDGVSAPAPQPVTAGTSDGSDAAPVSPGSAGGHDKLAAPALADSVTEAKSKVDPDVPAEQVESQHSIVLIEPSDGEQAMETSINTAEEQKDVNGAAEVDSSTVKPAELLTGEQAGQTDNTVEAKAEETGKESDEMDIADDKSHTALEPVSSAAESGDKQDSSAELNGKPERKSECEGKADIASGLSTGSVCAAEANSKPSAVVTEQDDVPCAQTAAKPIETSEKEEHGVNASGETGLPRSDSSPHQSAWGLGTQSTPLIETPKLSQEDPVSAGSDPGAVKEQQEREPGVDSDIREVHNFPVGAGNSDSVGQPEPMETEDSKDDVLETQDMGLQDMTCLKENTDTIQSATCMSEDSKLVFNVDSLLSCGQDESGDSSTAVKHPSAVVPFGENANSSMPLMGDKSLLEGENSNFSFLDESSQSNSLAEKPSRPKRARRSSISDIQDSKLETEDGLQPFTAERVFEYQWPQDGGDWYLLQEQVSEYLGVLSFKRKYPDLTRRTCDKLEKEFLREKGVVTETQSDLGLTALRSEEVYDLMMKDYPDKYHEYATVLHEREKQKISDKHKEYEVAQPKLEKSKMADYIKKAAKSAAEYNRHLLRERREERLAYFDLQTFMIQYPEGRYKKLPAECTKPSAYPVALIPGQFQDHYCSYTSDELRYFPLNTALYDPPKKMHNTLAKPAGSSESSSDDSSEDKSGSSSDSTGSGSGSSDSETPVTAVANGNTPSASNVPTTATTATATTTTSIPDGTQTPSRKSAKKAGKPAGRLGAKTPSKTPGKMAAKGKRKIDVGAEAETESAGAAGETQPSPSPAPNEGAKAEDEEEDKDKCRICKNAVLFLKYKRVETKMIKCSECGKIAHPSCLDLTDKMVQVVTTYPWQCMECKTCVECMDPYDEDKMLFCDRCDRGYHTFCVGLRCLPTGRWECRSCKGTDAAKSRRGRPLKPT